MTPQICTLEHLAYIYECIALGIMGEGKTELDKLAALQENDERYSFPGSQSASESLKIVASLYRDNEYIEAAGILSRVSRSIWQEVMKEHV